MTIERHLPRTRLPFRSDRDTAAPYSDAVRAGDRVYLSGQNAAGADGKITALGDPTAQAHAALDRLEQALVAAGGSLANITKLTTSIIDRGHRSAVYAAISKRLANVHPVSTGLVVAGLPVPELMVQIDAEALIPSGRAESIKRLRKYEYPNWHGQGFAWQGAMVSIGENELFVRGQSKW